MTGAGTGAEGRVLGRKPGGAVPATGATAGIPAALARCRNGEGGNDGTTIMTRHWRHGPMTAGAPIEAVVAAAK